ncbi:MAG: hypothetical protein RMA76_15220 [Deltaproteobacteria bacterium]|jgi:hypothetical protein
MSASLRSFVACLCAVSTGTACVSSDRTGPTKSRRIDVRRTPNDAYTYRVDEVRGTLPRAITIRLSRSQGCFVSSKIEKTYNVTTSVEWPDFWMWGIATAAAGFALGFYGVPLLFGDDSLPDNEQPFPASDPDLMGILFGTLFFGLAAVFPTGTDRSTSVDTEVEDTQDERKDACYDYEPVKNAEVRLGVDADGGTQTKSTDANGLVQFEVGAREWQKSIGRRRFGMVAVPNGTAIPIDMTSALTAHARTVVDRAKRQQKPPRLTVFAGLEDPRGNGDGVLDAGERADLVVRVENEGGGTGYAVKAGLELASGGGAIRLEKNALSFGDIAPGASVVRRMEIIGEETLKTGTGELAIKIEEEMGFGILSPARVRFATKKLRGPELKLAAYEIFDGESAWAQGDGKNTIGPGEQIELRLKIANVGPGASRNVFVRGASQTSGVSFVREQIELGRLASGQSKTATLVFRVTNQVPKSPLRITLDLVEQRQQFSRQQKLSLPMEQTVASTKVIDVTSSNDVDRSACPDASSWVVAVMNMRGTQDDARVTEAMTRQLRTSASERRLKVVSSSAQDQELKRIVNEAKAETFKECYDEACQVELGKALAASHLLVSSLERFGGQCTVAWEILELKGETTVCGSSQRGGCEESDLLKSLDAVRGRLPAGR